MTLTYEDKGNIRIISFYKKEETELVPPEKVVDKNHNKIIIDFKDLNINDLGVYFTTNLLIELENLTMRYRKKGSSFKIVCSNPDLRLRISADSTLSNVYETIEDAIKSVK